MMSYNFPVIFFVSQLKFYTKPQAFYSPGFQLFMKKGAVAIATAPFPLPPEAGEPAEDLIGVAFARHLQNPEHKIKRIGHGLNSFPLRMRYYSAA